jgi:hypothetical protein
MENENFREDEKPFELRMYFFTIYQLMGIQKGIQAGHAALEYALKYSNDEEYLDFAKNWKTWVILNGGTTNDERDFNGISEGTLNQIGDKLYDNDIKFSFFREPDLNNSLTAICFILDERVFNKKEYPDFNIFLSGRHNFKPEFINNTDNDTLIELYNQDYKEWVRLVGGMKNVFLRELINGKKLA